MAQLHVCGRCGEEFADEAGYLGHVCGETGHTPETPADPELQAILSEKALARGAARKQP